MTRTRLMSWSMSVGMTIRVCVFLYKQTTADENMSSHVGWGMCISDSKGARGMLYGDTRAASRGRGSLVGPEEWIRDTLGARGVGKGYARGRSREKAKVEGDTHWGRLGRGGIGIKNLSAWCCLLYKS